MSTFAVILSYCIVGSLVGCRVTSVVAWRMHRAKHPLRHREDAGPKGDLWFGGSLLGLVAELIWPMVVIAYAARGWAFAPPKDVQVERREKELAKLEREAGIR